MAARTTNFPDGHMTRAFRALEAVLREHAPLAAGVKTWAVGDGSGLDRMPEASGMLPYLRMVPVTRPNEVMAESLDITNLGVRVDIAVAGTVDEDLLNFWDCVQDALVRSRPFRDTNVRCFLQGQGVLVSKVERPANDAWHSESDPPSVFLAGSGMILLRLSRPA